MSSYKRETKHPQTGKWEIADWIDDYYGSHKYGVKFSDGYICNPDQIHLETREEVENNTLNTSDVIIQKTKVAYTFIDSRNGIVEAVGKMLLEAARISREVITNK